MIEAKTFEMPGISEKFGTSKTLEDFSVKYFKADLDDLSALSELQRIETEGIKGQDVVVLTKDKFTFMEKYFIIISYMERND